MEGRELILPLRASGSFMRPALTLFRHLFRTKQFDPAFCIEQ